MKHPKRALSVRVTATVLLAAVALCSSLLALTGSAATARVQHTIDTAASFDAATQSHPGACSQSTLDVSQAVGDLNANGILGQYASLVGVKATGQALASRMDSTLVVAQVAQTTTTANHGCTTDGIIFPTGSRTLTAGETVGVALPASLRSRLCSGSTVGCERTLLTFHTVFPTNCWNLDQGTVQVAVYLRARVKAKTRIAQPSAKVSTTCGTTNAGTSTVTLTNGARATTAASFDVNGTSYGPVPAGKSIEVAISLRTGSDVEIKVSSEGQMLLDESLPADPCSVTKTTTTTTPVTTTTVTPAPAPKADPTATAAFSCSAGGVVVTLANGAAATADATFTVNGTTYGPLAPGASEKVTVAIAQATAGTVTVSSGGQTILAAASYTNSCKAGPTATASVGCSQLGNGGGTLVVGLGDGSSATLPAQFTVTASGNTTAGYGPISVGPVAIGSTDTLLIPVDASGNTVTVTIVSGSQTLVSQTLPGCVAQDDE